MTRPRLAVLAAVHAYPHADTDSIFGAVRDQLSTVSQRAVYDEIPGWASSMSAPPGGRSDPL